MLPKPDICKLTAAGVESFSMAVEGSERKVTVLLERALGDEDWVASIPGVESLEFCIAAASTPEQATKEVVREIQYFSERHPEVPKPDSRYRQVHSLNPHAKIRFRGLFWLDLISCEPIHAFLKAPFCASCCPLKFNVQTKKTGSVAGCSIHLIIYLRIPATIKGTRCINSY